MRFSRFRVLVEVPEFASIGSCLVFLSSPLIVKKVRSSPRAEHSDTVQNSTRSWQVPRPPLKPSPHYYSRYSTTVLRRG
jgi:hypothetical protein